MKDKYKITTKGEYMGDTHGLYKDVQTVQIIVVCYNRICVLPKCFYARIFSAYNSSEICFVSVQYYRANTGTPMHTWIYTRQSVA